jgi:hypothetical protein
MADIMAVAAASSVAATAVRDGNYLSKMTSGVIRKTKQEHTTVHELFETSVAAWSAIILELLSASFNITTAFAYATHPSEILATISWHLALWALPLYHLDPAQIASGGYLNFIMILFWFAVLLCQPHLVC